MTGRPSQYRPTREGRRALEGLDWPRALRDPRTCAFMRAFLHDLCDALGEDLPLVPSLRAPWPWHPCTSRAAPAAAPRALRNL